jgi:glycerate kinase
MAHDTDPPAPASPAWRKARGVGISQRVLIACAPFGSSLSAEAVASAIARGVQDGGLPEPDYCAVPIPGGDGEAVRRALEELDFDARMRRARAVIVGAERLEERTLAGSVTFEIATRARQGGVPTYAVTRESTLDAFDARMLDLQVIFKARGRRALVDVGLELAQLV